MHTKDNDSNVTEMAIGKQINKDKIKAQIYTVHGIRVMLDSDIAAYFGTETGALNRAMKRNRKRFPISFCFQLTKEELENLKCQSGISSQFESYCIWRCPVAAFAAVSGHGAERVAGFLEL